MSSNSQLTDQPIYRYIEDCFRRADHLQNFFPDLQSQIDGFFSERPHGRTLEWNEGLESLPTQSQDQASIFNFTQDTLNISAPTKSESQSENSDTTAASMQTLEDTLSIYKPWRKGPFQLGDIFIDTEWRSDWKWQRIQPHISSLKDRHVLDIGCGNGYHLFRMLGDGAQSALGIDPTRLFLYQFHILRHFLPQAGATPELSQSINAWILPLKSEHLPKFKLFDTVFSLGVLYHRRSPIDHLTELLSFLRPGGELVLETLIVDGNEQTVLVPQDRYAKMANVWFLPSTQALENWLRRAGFTNVRTVDINQTSIEEQRATRWMDFHSLAEFLDPEDHNLTAEGLPAPKRALVIANKP